MKLNTLLLAAAALATLTSAAPSPPSLRRRSVHESLRSSYMQRRKATNAAHILAATGATGPALPPGVEPSAGCTQCKSSLSFNGTQAQAYAVGTQIPSLPFKTKNSWAGNVAVTAPTATNKPSLFFWLWGKDDVTSGDDLVVWLNGGPGCSSLGGMVQENGPFLYESRLEKPYVNPYSWTKAANILYVEQPVGVGFTTGKASFTTELQLADEFASFLDNFYLAFPELKAKKLWITGESYAGTYIPYFMNKLYTAGKTPQLQGGIIIDGTFTDEQLQEQPVAYQYAVQHQAELKFTAADLAAIKAEADKCGLSDFVEKNLHYPPTGRLPAFSRACTPWDTMYTLANTRNPTFDVYNIDMVDPSTTSPLGNPNGGALQQQLTPTFFDNYALQTYIHAPHKKWVECATVFANGDQSPPSDTTPSYDHTIVANVIERSKQFIIMQGNLDALIITNGSALALQNLTWNGAQGFSQPPRTPLYDTDGNQGGTLTQERGLIYAEVPKAGHMIPGDTPATGLAALLKLIGAREWTK